MSKFENYTKTSRSYDKTRIPAGVEIILGVLAKPGRPLDQIKLLDAGCGTGNYSRSILPHVGQIKAVDLNQGMLDIAAEKFKSHADQGRIEFHQSSIDQMPFKNKSFDAIMVNQVLHHLEEMQDADFPVCRRVFMEFHRVLKPGGSLIINTSSHEQIRNGYWFYKLIPEAVEKLCRRYLPLDTLAMLLTASGFSINGRFVALDAMCRGADYFDKLGPLKKEWRDGDSTFALVTDTELKRIQNEVSKMEADGTLASYVETQDRSRKHIGQTTFVAAARN
ncbi:class I SAM-dependent methyltransferase [Desulfobacula toluolica]|uniref:Uncharacterized protein related to methyltransferase type 11 n=1 Tax=Desulfobacula toluolica (strain DSM 7467 / Tol2) TaxID=651182 RepID=K0N4N5_DESTT|nr:class I SAM-dependent methyltransferase [Desulfobacula toluolica]CCK79049.1 uncharacterized protein related to methyltransferase type 11 [Desulfobacula toluolica Tol2]